MARYAIIEDGKVSNVVESSAEFAQDRGWIQATGAAAIGALWDGANFTAAPPVAPVVPAVVPMLNAHLVLIESGKFDALQAHLEAMPGKDGKIARAYFDKALTMRRDHPLVSAIKPALNWTDAEIDALFLAADALVV